MKKFLQAATGWMFVIIILVGIGFLVGGTFTTHVVYEPKISTLHQQITKLEQEKAALKKELEHQKSVLGSVATSLAYPFQWVGGKVSDGYGWVKEKFTSKPAVPQLPPVKETIKQITPKPISQDEIKSKAEVMAKDIKSAGEGFWKGLWN